MLVVAHLDRITRRAPTLSQLLEDVYSLRAGDMPEVDDLMMRIYAAIAQKERELISERTRAALAAAKAHGKALGGDRGYRPAGEGRMRLRLPRRGERQRRWRPSRGSHPEPQSCWRDPWLDRYPMRSQPPKNRTLPHYIRRQHVFRLSYFRLKRSPEAAPEPITLISLYLFDRIISSAYIN